MWEPLLSLSNRLGNAYGVKKKTRNKIHMKFDQNVAHKVSEKSKRLRVSFVNILTSRVTAYFCSCRSFTCKTIESKDTLFIEDNTFKSIVCTLPCGPHHQP